MGIVELSLALLLGALLGTLAMAGRPAPLPAWSEVFAPGVMGWLCGVQGILFQRQADYMLAYLANGRLHPVLWYCAWALACVLLTLVGSRMVQGVRRGFPAARGKVAWAGGVLLAGCGALLWPRLSIFGSTLEFVVGLGRPLSTQPAAGMLLTLTLLGSAIPVMGAIGLVALDSRRVRRTSEASVKA